MLGETIHADLRHLRLAGSAKQPRSREAFGAHITELVPMAALEEIVRERQ